MTVQVPTLEGMPAFTSLPLSSNSQFHCLSSWKVPPSVSCSSPTPVGKPRYLEWPTEPTIQASGCLNTDRATLSLQVRSLGSASQGRWEGPKWVTTFLS